MMTDDPRVVRLLRANEALRKALTTAETRMEQLEHDAMTFEQAARRSETRCAEAEAKVEQLEQVVEAARDVRMHAHPEMVGFHPAMNHLRRALAALDQEQARA